jgi:hypothetical protein
MSEWVSLSVRGLLQFSNCDLLPWKAGGWGQGLVGNPEEVECPPLEVATEQQQWRHDYGHYSVCVCVCVCVRARVHAHACAAMTIIKKLWITSGHIPLGTFFRPVRSQLVPPHIRNIPQSSGPLTLCWQETRTSNFLWLRINLTTVAVGGWIFWASKFKFSRW